MIEIKDLVGEPLAIIVQKSDMQDGTTWFCKDYDGLQVARMKYNSDKSFEAHTHIMRPRLSNYTEEAIIVFQGTLRVTIYDLGKEVVYSGYLYAGDMVISRRGYHQYEVIEDNSIFYEFKNGPFTTRSEDKKFL